jgi:hypothetical protein
MRSIFFSAVLASILVLLAPAPAKASGATFKVAEAKHFARDEGVELSPEFTDYLYAELRSELGKTKLFAQVIGEGEVVDDADAPASVVVEGTIAEYKKGSPVKDSLIGFGAGMRSLRLEATVYRRSDHKVLTVLHEHLRVSPRLNEKVMARDAAKHLAGSIKNSLKQGPETSQ